VIVFAEIIKLVRLLAELLCLLGMLSVSEFVM